LVAIFNNSCDLLLLGPFQFQSQLCIHIILRNKSHLEFGYIHILMLGLLFCVERHFVFLQG
jgi:hypothetical protein